MSAITWLAPLSSWLVMLHLGVQAAGAPPASAARPRVAFYIAHYFAPLSVVFLLGRAGIIAPHDSAGLAVCVLSGIGTSAVPWALRDGAGAAAISGRLAWAAAIALVFLPAASFVYADTDQALQRFAYMALILLGALWIPWCAGKAAGRRHALPIRAQRLLGRAATLSVIVLIALVAWKEVPRLPAYPWLVFACGLLVATQGIGGALADARTGLATTAVIRNLTLATLVLVSDANASSSMTALAAFGLVMYLGVWPTSRLAAQLRKLGRAAAATDAPTSAGGAEVHGDVATARMASGASFGILPGEARQKPPPASDPAI